MVTADGYRVVGVNEIPQNTREISINRNGEVLAYVEDRPEPENKGKVEMAVFVNPSGLEALGDNLFRDTPASGPPQQGNPGMPGFGTLRQRFLETSNVNVVQEITDLISAQRAYEMNSKVVETGDQMAASVTNMR